MPWGIEKLHWGGKALRRKGMWVSPLRMLELRCPIRPHSPNRFKGKLKESQDETAEHWTWPRALGLPVHTPVGPVQASHFFSLLSLHRLNTQQGLWCSALFATWLSSIEQLQASLWVDGSGVSKLLSKTLKALVTFSSWLFLLIHLVPVTFPHTCFVWVIMECRPPPNLCMHSHGSGSSFHVTSLLKPYLMPSMSLYQHLLRQPMPAPGGQALIHSQWMASSVCHLSHFRSQDTAPVCKWLHLSHPEMWGRLPASADCRV